MNTTALINLSEKYLMSTYARFPVVFTKGLGASLWDNDGKEYLDFVSGLAVCNLGHCHPAVTAALQQQAETLLHVSNLYHIPPQAKLAQKLVENSFADKVFFCNSGAEANEAAIKLARRYAWGKWGGTRYKIITFNESFHGRTMATITATAQEKFHQGFAPLLEGFSYVPLNDLTALESAIDEQTAAVLVEPIQIEGGVNLPEKGFLEGVRRLCDKHRLLLLLDEVQTGIGRTGKLFGYQHHRLEPDIISLAKGLGGGTAIGAILAKEEVARAFVPGTHAATFGGNFLACAAGLAVLETIFQENLLAHCREMGQYLQENLKTLKDKYGFIKEVRGRGLIQGMEMDRPVLPVVNACMREGVLLITAGEKVLRFLPPLIIKPQQIDQMITTLDKVLQNN